MIRNYPAYFPVEEKQYTIEIYKRDSRTTSGERLVKTYDTSAITHKSAISHVDYIAISQYPTSKGYRIKLHDSN